MPRRLLAAAALALLVFGTAATALAGDEGWRSEGRVAGMQVDRRDVKGSSFDEIRVTTTSPLALSSLCDAIYPKRFDGKLEGRFKHRELLHETETERWTYEQIAVAVVSDRDYVMHVKVDQPAASGRCEITFETDNHGARPPQPGFVRIPVIRGHWSLVPTADGQVRVSYEVYSDPGGGVPAFLARGGQKSAAVDFMKTILARADSAKAYP